MTFDPTQPTDTTKIRNLGIVIRPNWQAIENANSSFKPVALNFNNRTPLAVSNDPTAIANAYLLYCKDDVGGDPELFGINQNSDVVQLTDGDVLNATPGHTFLPGGILMQWNRVVAPTGSTVTFPIAFSAAPYYVNFIPTGTSGTNRIDYRLSGNPIAASFSPIIVKSSDNAGLTETIYYLAIGPR